MNENKMTEKIRKVFELLGVEPNEEFYLKNRYCVYKLNEKLIVYCNVEGQNNWDRSLLSIIDLLTKEEIIKLPNLTEADKNAVRHLRDGGMKYVARDITGQLYAFNAEPIKNREVGAWFIGLVDCNSFEVFKNLFEFVQWEDEEPFCIENLEV